ncbi:hypothetical protein ACRALDRAFT_1081268 [Sodiomyces alcalophilus JCM 7366]|uniref:uncharacterized protein n=1 Tax=Sodiomyces alcalophilus JCM 7366 TaxID=591952 RepID=UPI0039B62F9F
MAGARLIDVVETITTSGKQEMNEMYEAIKKVLRNINKAMEKQDGKKVAEDHLADATRRFDEVCDKVAEVEFRKFIEERRRIEEEERRKAEKKFAKALEERRKAEQALFKRNTERAIRALQESERLAAEAKGKAEEAKKKAAGETGMLWKAVEKAIKRHSAPARAGTVEEYSYMSGPPAGEKSLRSVVSNASPLTTQDDDVYDDAYVSLSEIALDRIWETEQRARAEREADGHDGDWVVVKKVTADKPVVMASERPS